MRVLVACEYSGRVRDAFRALGHDAWSCDFLPSENNSAFHLQQDVRSVLHDGWDMMIAHPDCTYLTNSAEWAYRDHQTKNIRPGTLIGAARRDAREAAIEFVLMLANANIPRIAIENPVGVLSTRWRKPDQFIQPYEYGEDASKKTCLWLKGLPKLMPTKRVQGRLITHTHTAESRLSGGQTRPTAGKTSSLRLRTAGRNAHAPIKDGRSQWLCSGVG